MPSDFSISLRYQTFTESIGNALMHYRHKTALCRVDLTLRGLRMARMAAKIQFERISRIVDWRPPNKIVSAIYRQRLKSALSALRMRHKQIHFQNQRRIFLKHSSQTPIPHLIPIRSINLANANTAQVYFPGQVYLSCRKLPKVLSRVGFHSCFSEWKRAV